MRVQTCRNGCGKAVTVQMDESDGKWKPYEVNVEEETVLGLHNCPKSAYNMKKQQAAPTTEKEESSVHYQILQELRKANSLLAKIAGVEE